MPARSFISSFSMKHIIWIDDLKGLGIFLIVLGHVVVTVMIMSSGRVADALGLVFDYIYSFHVPFFFLLAGLTFSTRKSFLEFAKGKFWRLMVPYFVWGFFSAALFAVMGKLAVQNMESAEFSGRSLAGEWWTPFLSILHGGGWPDGKGFRFNGVLWFLPVLFSAELIYYPIAKHISKTWQFVAISSAIVLVLSPLYWPFLKLFLPYGLCRVPEYLVFIMIGDWIGRNIRSKVTLSMPSDSVVRPFGFMALWPWAFFVVSLCLAACLCVMSDEVVRYPLIVLKALATIIPLLLIARYRPFKCFIAFAPHTIAIMIFHKFLLVPMQIVVTKAGVMATYPISSAVLSVLVFTAVCIGACYFGSRILTRCLPWTIGARYVLAK